MNNTKKYDITIGSGFIKNFQFENYKLERVFSEFIDNSLQSFLDNQDILKNLEDGKKCKVSIIWDKNQIIIEDNSFGMNEEEFGRALKLNAKNPNANKDNQLGMYGIGLKYASVYLGNKYTISTTRYDSGSRISASVDIDELSENNPNEIEAIFDHDQKENHGTIITITKLVKELNNPNKENELREKLGTIYHHYLERGILNITLNKIPIKYEKPEIYMDENQQRYIRNINDSFTFKNITYKFTGWIGILNKGNRSKTGLNMMQANRCIALNYKPEKIFDKGNLFPTLRVVGEIRFEGKNYVLSYTKDKFVWNHDGAEDKFLEKLASNESVSYIIKQSKKIRVKDDDRKISNQTKKILSDSAASTPTIKEDINNNEEKSVKELPKNEFEKDVNEIIFEKYNVLVNDQLVYLYVSIQRLSSDVDCLQFDKYKDGYSLIININNQFYVNKFKKNGTIASVNSIIIILVQSMLQSQGLGIKLADSIKLLDTINEIMVKQNG